MFLNIDYLIILVNDMQIVAFLLIHLVVKVKTEGGRFFKRGTCSTSWPSGWALIRGRAFIRALALILGYNRYLPSHIQHVLMG